MAKTRSKRNDKKKDVEESNQLDIMDQDFIPLDDTTEPPINGSNDAGLEAFAFSSARDNRSSFFGLLDRSELEYFKNAENMLATNALNATEKEPFIDSLFTECKGKELKLATNQVCSKLFERMVQLADNDQLVQLAQAFENFAVDLAYQKFSSHCLEALIRRASQNANCEHSIEVIAKNLSSNALDLMHDRYGAHVLSTLILVLSGLSGRIDLQLRSKRSALARKHTEIEENALDADDVFESVEVSDQLKRTLRELIINLIEQMDTVGARKLCLQQESSPVMQALVAAEAELMSSYKLINLILEDSSGFVTHSLSDPVGSHFIETCIKVLPAKRVAKFVDRLPLAKLATSENDFSRYIVQAVLSRQCKLPRSKKMELIKDDLKEALQKNKNLVVEALNVDFETVASATCSELDSKNIDLGNTANAALYEKLSNYPPFVEKAIDVLMAMDDKEVLNMGLDATKSYVLQSLLKPEVPLISRRKLLNILVPAVPAFAVNAYGSHIVDSLWDASFKLKFVRERIANELLKASEQVKHSPYGKKVWKNWSMEKYTHRRHDWWQTVKDHEDKLKDELPAEAIAPPAPQNTKKPFQKQQNRAFNRGGPQSTPPSKKRKT